MLTETLHDYGNDQNLLRHKKMIEIKEPSNLSPCLNFLTVARN